MNPASFQWLRRICRWTPSPLRRFQWWRRWCMGYWATCGGLWYGRNWIPLPKEGYWCAEEHW